MRLGEAVYTKAGNLPSKYIIHVVGPIWKGDILDNNAPFVLKEAIHNSLKIADELD